MIFLQNTSRDFVQYGELVSQGNDYLYIDPMLTSFRIFSDSELFEHTSHAYVRPRLRPARIQNKSRNEGSSERRVRRARGFSDSLKLTPSNTHHRPSRFPPLDGRIAASCTRVYIHTYTHNCRTNAYLFTLCTSMHFSWDQSVERAAASRTRSPTRVFHIVLEKLWHCSLSYRSPIASGSSFSFSSPLPTHVEI